MSHCMLSVIWGNDPDMTQMCIKCVSSMSHCMLSVIWGNDPDMTQMCIALMCVLHESLCAECYLGK
jgi:hypothetical protein